jgi:hypothetical protein
VACESLAAGWRTGGKLFDARLGLGAMLTRERQKGRASEPQLTVSPLAEIGDWLTLIVMVGSEQDQVPLGFHRCINRHRGHLV